ncbi:EFR1 family ferrodoxin [Clostridium massiliamazoniense]|uniref:EFR1 family ferrodoxin n=1 Tax=Clostridium massiliamazoniense TaxID=1347366 RepID=UPI0006D86384|nr:EFR1 family ferrodoxin [Clostridium massiliamazoniense]
MDIKKISTVFFSPTKSTKNILSLIGKDFPLPLNEIDITPPSTITKNIKFSNNELVIFGVPVYGGRIPKPAVKRIKNIKGNATPTLLVVTYGNRDYDDALLELKNIVEENGFFLVGAAAFITKHSIMHSVAQGRPDRNDLKEIENFSKKALRKIQNITNVNDLPLITVKGNFPYKEYNGIPLKPQGTKKCIKCLKCVENCPVNAISNDTPHRTNKNLCISCMRCVKICPTHTRKLNKLMLSIAEKSFAKKYTERKEPEIFI